MRPLPLALLVLASAPLFTRGRAPVVTGGQGPTLSARECQPCHEREYQQWSGSRHAQAFSNTLFTASFAESNAPGCVNCHAPLAEQRAQHFQGEATKPALLPEGVNCAVCHLREGTLLTRRAPSEAALEAHPIRREPALGTPDFCGGCHEFPFPDLGRQASAPLMQETLTEWRASTAARNGQTCQSCHMPEGVHAFPGGHDLDFVRGALKLEWQRQGPSKVCAVVRSRSVGHAVPTGDLFRRLRLRLCEDAACERPVRQRLMSRRIIATAGGALKETDTRIPANAERTECFEWSKGTTAPAHWTLELLYAEPRIESQLPDAETRAVLLSGPL
ncbi:multiheme c-type cytochrome [Corallococcus carmarthensis]|uniref:Cytochrome c-552/4 domain-containing protein n=1 Tax=Corallococcus carmarthensis TaxID=2316728 RepID=A0A3A8JT98_9BACT|nr:multiheme c-type cytochrome [Corallococcus carmarthensis]RKG98415.1 hypothetical protein D7X32_29635 [Corallococcus carmarthensis]